MTQFLTHTSFVIPITTPGLARWQLTGLAESLLSGVQLWMIAILSGGGDQINCPISSVRKVKDRYWVHTS